MLFICCKQFNTALRDMNIIPVLDTDDLSIEMVEYEKLVELVYSGTVDVRNVNYKLRAYELTLAQNCRSFHSLGVDLEMLGGVVRYKILPNKEALFINHKPYMIRCALAEIPTSKEYMFCGTLFVNKHRSDCTLFNSISVLDEEQDRGISYIYKLGQCIVCVYHIVTLNTTYYSYLLFNLDGEFLGIIPDKRFKSDIYDTGVGSMFLSKFRSMGRDRGVY